MVRSHWRGAMGKVAPGLDQRSLIFLSYTGRTFPPDYRAPRLVRAPAVLFFFLGIASFSPLKFSNTFLREQLQNGIQRWRDDGCGEPGCGQLV